MNIIATSRIFVVDSHANSVIMLLSFVYENGTEQNLGEIDTSETNFLFPFGISTDEIGETT